MSIEYKPTIYLLPTGSFLYRASRAKHSELDPIYCEETGKVGLYFGTHPIISLAMAIEYRDVNKSYKKMIFSNYITTDDIELFEGKYGFRYINPDRYFTETGELIVNVETLEEEMINHFDPEAFPIVEYEFPEGKNYGEIFLNTESLKHLEFINSYEIDVESLEAKINEIGIRMDCDYGYTPITPAHKQKGGT